MCSGKMEIEFVDHMDNVLEIALVGNEGQTDDAKELDFVPTEQFDDPRQWIER